MEEESDNERKSRKARRMAIKAASTARKKNKYAVQKVVTEQNKKKKLLKRIKQHPNDVQAQKLYKQTHGG